MAVLEVGSRPNTTTTSADTGLFLSRCPFVRYSTADFVTNLVWGVFFKVDEDEKLASLMSDYWTAFAKTSDPNFNGAPIDWKLWKGKRRCVRVAHGRVEGGSGRWPEALHHVCVCACVRLWSDCWAHKLRLPLHVVVVSWQA